MFQPLRGQVQCLLRSQAAEHSGIHTQDLVQGRARMEEKCFLSQQAAWTTGTGQVLPIPWLLYNESTGGLPKQVQA